MNLEDITFACPKCGKQKKSKELKFSKQGTILQCKECVSEYNKNYQINNRDARRIYKREYKLETKYNLTTEQYNQLLKSQGGVCAICRTNNEQLVVDHNHKTNQVRAILCYSCNAGIGMFKEDEDRIWNAMEYLKKHEWSKTA